MKRSVNAANAVVRALLTVSAAAAILCGQASAQNNVISKWTFENNTTPDATGVTGPTAFADEGVQAGVAILNGTHASAASAWSTPVGNGSTNSYSVNTWTASDYFQFQVSTLGLSNIGVQFDQVSSSTGPRDFVFSYSTNGSSFTNFANYVVQPNANPAWAGAGAVGPVGLDTFNFNLSSISALNNLSNAYFRLTAANPIVASQIGSTAAVAGSNRLDNVTVFSSYDSTQAPIVQPFTTPSLPQTGDIVIGIGSGREKTTIELVRGAAPGMATKPAQLSPWTSTNLVRFVRFDNLGGTTHNSQGNLLGVDAGVTVAGGGKIYSFGTKGSVPQPAGQLLASTGGAAGTGTRLGGLSVAPDNSKVAVTGIDTGRVMVYDYTPGNAMGTGSPALSGLRTSNAILDTTSNTVAASNNPAGQQGTAWRDSNTVMAFSSVGTLFSVNATTMAETTLKSVTTGAIAQSSTAIAYNPAVSPYVYATYSGFASNTTKNTLFVFDPNNAYADLTSGGIDFSTSAGTIRDIALDASGNLIVSTNNATGRLEYIPNSQTPGTITANSSVDFFNDDLFLSQPGFTGLDIGFAPPVVVGVPGDYNNNGTVDAADYVLWKNGGPLQNEVNAPGTVNQQDYVEWRSRFGNSGAGTGLGGTSVPEPTAFVMLMLGLVPMYLLRRSA